MEQNQKYLAKGNTFKRLITLPFLFLAWFSPHKGLRVFFHKLRGVKVGKNVEIGYFCIIGNVHPNMIYIDDNAVITARTTILEHDNSLYYTGSGKVKYGKVHVKRNAFIGIGSVIMPGVSIGEGSIIGALSFVNTDVEAFTINAGVPVKKIKSIRKNV